MQENFKTVVSLGYTLVREQKNLQLESKNGFWDVPKLITTLLGLPVYY